MYSPPPTGIALPTVITSFSAEAVGEATSGFIFPVNAVSNAPTSNTVTYVPFQIGKPFTVKKVGWINGNVATNGNAQVGVYSEAFAQLFECTATTTSGTNAKQTIDITDYTLPAPARYYMAFRMSSATDRVNSCIPAAGLIEACGVMMELSQADLPATATPVANTYALLPLFYLSGNTTL